LLIALNLPRLKNRIDVEDGSVGGGYQGVSEDLNSRRGREPLFLCGDQNFKKLLTNVKKRINMVTLS